MNAPLTFWIGYKEWVMNRLDTIQHERKWQLACNLARISEQWTRNACEARESRLSRRIHEHALSIARELAYGHVASDAGQRSAHLLTALDQARSIEVPLAELAEVASTDWTRDLARAFLQVDQLREAIFLTLDEDREARLSA